MNALNIKKQKDTGEQKSYNIRPGIKEKFTKNVFFCLNIL
jgi:hypothetical protein